MILASKEYDEECAKEWLNAIINERKEREEIAGRKRQEEIAERKHQEEIQMVERRRIEEQEYEERKRKEEYEGRKRMEEYEERKRKDEMEFELQKIRLGAEGHKAINCVSKESKYSSDESLYVRQDVESSEESNSYLKKAKLNNCDNVQALIGTGSSCCLLKISVNQKLKLKLEPATNKIYCFGNQKMPALTSIGRINIYWKNIEVDNVKAESISIYVVLDDAQSVDLIIGRTWLDLAHISYAKIGKRVHIGNREDELFRNFPIDEKVNPVCLKRLETAQLESESLQIKNSSQQKIMGSLVNDLKMVKNEIKLLQGDIKNFTEERHSLLLQIQEKNKNVENLKSDNDSLVLNDSS
ncbi:hypothetical protein AVEN_140322-1 [Araneus ventricosus]|uniref:Uncharacterized protein n=1 Tax=Araneus ventricosus TaxID=182803 RepID=A0A4Y2FD31_ARAVE|nr:hypothetical protein AVEN_140322-1 [Araneus ventricosus]